MNALTHKTQAPARLRRPAAVSITAMAREHLAAVAELERRCFPNPWTEGHVRGSLDDPCGILFVAANGTRIVGYVCGIVVMDECSLYRICCDPGFRRRGIAGVLLSVFLQEAARRGAVVCRLEVGAKNTAALAFYRRAGFQESGKRPGYYSESRDDALLLDLRLEHSPTEDKGCCDGAGRYI